MFNKEELNNLLLNAGLNIEQSIKIYMIGGCALSFKELKLATKDIDIIVRNQKIDAPPHSKDFNSFSEN